MSSSKRMNRNKRKRKLDMSIRNPELELAKSRLDMCVWACMAKAVASGSKGGRVEMVLQFELHEVIDEETGVVLVRPAIASDGMYQVFEDAEEQEAQKGEEEPAAEH